MRAAYFLLGWCFFGLGAVGVVIPGLPTVPFMLVALWLFSKSSRRFHDWLYSHRLFGPPLQQWREHGVIPFRAKLVAVLTMLMSLAYMIFVADVGYGIAASAAAVMLVGALFILRQPSRAPDHPGYLCNMQVRGEERWRDESPDSWVFKTWRARRFRSGAALKKNQ